MWMKYWYKKARYWNSIHLINKIIQKYLCKIKHLQINRMVKSMFFHHCLQHWSLRLCSRLLEGRQPQWLWKQLIRPQQYLLTMNYQNRSEMFQQPIRTSLPSWTRPWSDIYRHQQQGERGWVHTLITHNRCFSFTIFLLLNR